MARDQYEARFDFTLVDGLNKGLVRLPFGGRGDEHDTEPIFVAGKTWQRMQAGHPNGNGRDILIVRNLDEPDALVIESIDNLHLTAMVEERGQVEDEEVRRVAWMIAIERVNALCKDCATDQEGREGNRDTDPGT